jgi:hypothetical protein
MVPLSIQCRGHSGQLMASFSFKNALFPGLPLEISKLETEINDKESELQSLRNRVGDAAGNLNALSTLSVEIEVQKRELLFSEKN